MGKIIMPNKGWRTYSSRDFNVGDIIRLWLSYESHAVNLRQGEIFDPRKIVGIDEKLRMCVGLVGWAPLWGRDNGVVDDDTINLTNHNRRVKRLPYVGSFSYDSILVAEGNIDGRWGVV